MDMKHFNQFFTLTAIAALLTFSSCKYEEGPGISVRSKRDRIANEWKITGYQVDGSEDDARKKSFTIGDSVELIFIMTRNFSYAMNMSYTDNYTSPTGDKLLSPGQNDLYPAYQYLNAQFLLNNDLYKLFSTGGRWTFADKYKMVHFGANGFDDLTHPEGNDASLIKSDIVMLKNKMLKLEFSISGKKHRITFEPKNKEIVK